MFHVPCKITCKLLNWAYYSGFQLWGWGTNLFPKGTLAMSGDFFWLFKFGGGGGGLGMVTAGGTPVMLLNNLEHTGQPPTAKTDPNHRCVML